MGKPVIAAVHGYALGAGCEFAMICDIVIAAEGTKFGFPEASAGAQGPSGGLWYLPRLVGQGKAKELIFTSDRIDAQEAKEIGLVNKVVPLEQLDEEARKMAKKIAGYNPNVIRQMRTIMDQGLESSLETILMAEQEAAMLTALQGSYYKSFEEMAKKKK